jgi:hypothetical protein
MDPDLVFVIGLVVLVLAVPSIFGAIADGRAPRAAAIMILIGGGLLATAVHQKPGAYSLAGIPATFVTVVGRLVR